MLKNCIEVNFTTGHTVCHIRSHTQFNKLYWVLRQLTERHLGVYVALIPLISHVGVHYPQALIQDVRLGNKADFSPFGILNYCNLSEI